MYGEIIIGFNMVFNYAILSFASRMAKSQTTWKRLLLASFIGAFPVTLFPNSLFAIVIAFLGMVVCAYGVSYTAWNGPSIHVVIGALFD